MYKLAPSILAADFSRLGEEIRKIEAGGAHYVHIDVMDGCFVPNISIGVPVVKSLRRITEMTFDVHLMIDRPERYIDAFADAGADIICVHAEACSDVREVIKQIKARGKKPAVSIKPGTPVESVFGYLHEIEMLLLMSVEPGFGGQSFIPDALTKARVLADFILQNGLCTDIEMDGGIYLSNVSDVIRSGVNVVVAGSAIFASENPVQAVKDFYAAFENQTESKSI